MNPFISTALLMDAAGAASEASSGLPWFTLVYVAGFIAAVVGGSLAWYNSKRPPGWEGAERPDIVPDLKTEESDDSST